MGYKFDSGQLERLGWRQGAVLGEALHEKATGLAPRQIPVTGESWLLVTSHDCDVVNTSLEKEPYVEIIRALVHESAKPDKQVASGRNPRNLQLSLHADDGKSLILSLSVHNRWLIPRELLLQEAPHSHLPARESRLIAEWLAKRYIRAAFPTAFDQRWRAKQKGWQKLLKKYSAHIQGVYLRLSPLTELPRETPYNVELLVAATKEEEASNWRVIRREIEDAVEVFWGQFDPEIVCKEVDLRTTKEITISDVSTYQRFDADWVSFNDDTALTPAHIDMTS